MTKDLNFSDFAATKEDVSAIFENEIEFDDNIRDIIPESTSDSATDNMKDNIKAESNHTFKVNNAILFGSKQNLVGTVNRKDELSEKNNIKIETGNSTSAYLHEQSEYTIHPRPNNHDNTSNEALDPSEPKEAKEENLTFKTKAINPVPSFIETKGIQAPSLVETEAVGTIALVKTDAVQAPSLVETKVIQAPSLMEAETAGASPLVEAEDIEVKTENIGDLSFVEKDLAGKAIDSYSNKVKTFFSHKQTKNETGEFTNIGTVKTDTANVPVNQAPSPIFESGIDYTDIYDGISGSDFESNLIQKQTVDSGPNISSTNRDVSNNDVEQKESLDNLDISTNVNNKLKVDPEESTSWAIEQYDSLTTGRSSAGESEYEGDTHLHNNNRDINNNKNRSSLIG